MVQTAHYVMNSVCAQSGGLLLVVRNRPQPRSRVRTYSSTLPVVVLGARVRSSTLPVVVLGARVRSFFSLPVVVLEVKVRSFSLPVVVLEPGLGALPYPWLF